MADINSCTFTGRITRNAELRYSQSGSAIVKFSIAVNRGQLVEGKWQEKTSFFNLVWFGKGAEGCHPYLTKGKAVAVQCECRQEKYTDQNGIERQAIGFMVDNLQLMSSGQQKQNGDHVEDIPDDIPF